MKNLNRYVDPSLSEAEVEKYTSQILKQKFDTDLRLKYQQMLEQKHNVQREKKSNSKVLLVLLFGLSLAASLLLFKFVFQKTGPKSSDYKMMAMEYDAENPFIAKTISRTELSNPELQSIKAQLEFENENYEAALNLWEGLSDKTKEEEFLIAYSMFKLARYEDANSGFSKVLSLNDSHNYIPEAKFYKVLSLFAAGNSDEAIVLWNSYDKNSWEAKELQKIFSK